ncbi:MAG: hypothetical protein Q8N31_15050 [Reyranella sp.]|nr:hypothetical protein [Reyranella sp.]MDP3161334.1 hypothetical protein [Reyranella sp.]
MLRLPVTILALLLALAAVARAAEPDSWDRAYDAATGRRFIPLQLVIGGAWDGERTITYPVGTFAAWNEHGSVWVGPKNWTHPRTGETLAVYDRSRGGRNAADQVFAVRKDQVAIGRVADSRFGIEACDQEAKFPLGLWSQGESRSFEYTCWYGGKPRTMRTTLIIRDVDFDYGGLKHSLRLEWLLRDKDAGRELDHRFYVFAPGKGVVNTR